MLHDDDDDDDDGEGVGGELVAWGGEWAACPPRGERAGWAPCEGRGGFGRRMAGFLPGTH